MLDALDRVLAKRALQHTERRGDCLVSSRMPGSRRPVVSVKLDGQQRTIRVQRAAWMAWHDEAPDGRVTATCGNVHCVAADHLVLRSLMSDDELRREVAFVRAGGRPWHEIEKAVGRPLGTIVDKLRAGGPRYHDVALDASREERMREKAA